MGQETKVQNDIMEAIGCEPGVIVWRNNTGVARYCSRWRECAERYPCPHCGQMLDPRGDLRRVRYGLAVGSADLICCVDGRFVAGEVKTTKGRPSDEQKRWLESVRAVGGDAEIWRSVEDACAAVERQRNR